MSQPRGWDQLDQERRQLVENYISLLLGTQLELPLDGGQADATGDQANGDDKRGWVEIKCIKKNHYAYRRWWENGRKRSQYIGPVRGHKSRNGDKPAP